MFANMNNNLRLELLKNCVNDREQEAEPKDRVLHFANGYDICTENRNILMHSLTGSSIDQKLLNLTKRTKGNPVKTNSLHLKLVDVRKAADEIFAYHRFGLQLHLWLGIRPRGGSIKIDEHMTLAPPLPEKPPLPDKLLIPPR
jgi:hypothetical protein